jgi:hypothetical protein
MSAWTVIGMFVSAVSLWQGFGYALGGTRVTTSDGWGVLTNRYLLGSIGGLRAHGVIMMALGFALAVELRGPFDCVMLWVLRLLRTYSLFVAGTWIGSWWLYGLSWSPPGWWFLLAALTVWMTYFAPPDHRGSRDRDGRV